MVTKEERLTDVLGIIDKLDISPSMYRDSVEKYKAIGTFLSSKGINADFYPQGSFSLGTVVRPYKNNQDASFDLDAVCQIEINKEDTDPREIKRMVEKAFDDDETYSGKLEKFDKCCTIRYADIGGIGFSIDIVPSVKEDQGTILELMGKSHNPNLVVSSIAITDVSDEVYEWATNNPKGYKVWFDKINSEFLASNPIRNRRMMFEANRSIFASIEDIPIELERSALQRVIQILKRHRDVYFSKMADGDNLKPLSAIITIVVAMISQVAPSNLPVFDLLRFVLNEFDIYSQRQILNESQFTFKYGVKNVIQRPGGVWKLENPANPKDNFVDSWNSNSLLSKAFFNWIKQANSDFIQSVEKSDREFYAQLGASFGFETTRQIIKESKYSAVQPLVTLSRESQSKPWGAECGDQ